jgi:hypothetical protein
MKKIVIHTVVSFFSGGCSVYLYSSLIGIATFFSVNNSLHNWIFYLPKSFRKFGYLTHYSLIEILVSMIAMGLAGLIIGTITRRYLKFGVIGFLGALIVFLISQGTVFEWNTQTSLFLSQVILFFFWLCIFVFFAFLGEKIGGAKESHLKN